MKTDFSQLRFNALAQSSQQMSVPVSEPNRRSSLFGSHVFNDYKMLQYLTKDAIGAVRDAITSGSKIDRKLADQVAEGMKTWAIEMGATHYTHWFQPLTGATAEKHDAFFDIQDGQALEIFGGLNWCSKNQTPLVFQVEALEIPLRQGVTLLGILVLQLLFMGLHFVYPLFLFLIQEKHWTIKHLYLGL